MLAELSERTEALEADLAGLAGRRTSARELDRHAALLDEFLADLPDLLALPVHEKPGPEPGGGPGSPVPYRLTPETAKPRPGVDRDTMGRKLREVYEAIGLGVVAQKDGTLVIEWGPGQRRESRPAPGEPQSRPGPGRLVPEPPGGVGLPASSDSQR